MEIILELLLTAFVSLVFSFLIAKLVSFAMDADSDVETKSSIHAADDDDIVMEHLDLADEFKVQSFERSKVEGFERELEVELKAKVEEIEVQNEIKVQSEENQMKGLVEEEKGMKPESYDDDGDDDDDDDDDWEGIEKSELEKVFDAAAKFSEKNGDLGIGNEVEMELYGLHKIATEGACRESQPLAFMFSSRSKWNAWQRFGNMNPETAMEQYVALLSDKVPGWMEDESDVFVHGEIKLESSAGAVPGSMAPDKQAIFTHQRNMDSKSAPGVGDITASTSSEKQMVKDD